MTSLLGPSACVCNVQGCSKELHQLFLIVLEISLHDLHTRTEKTLKCSNLQNCINGQSRTCTEHRTKVTDDKLISWHVTLTCTSDISHSKCRCCPWLVGYQCQFCVDTTKSVSNIYYHRSDNIYSTCIIIMSYFSYQRI